MRVPTSHVDTAALGVAAAAVIMDQFGRSTFITSVGGEGIELVGPEATWPAAGTRLLGGELHADDAGDAVVVRETANGFQLWGAPWNDGGYYDAGLGERELWATVSTGGFNFDRSRQLMGDVNGDGLDDIVTIHHQATGGLRVWVHPNVGGTYFGVAQQ
jgi:hypothetical protein